MWYAWTVRDPFPGYWGLAVFIVLTLALDLTRIRLRGGEGTGSIAFMAIHAAGVIFGAFWGGVVVAVSTLWLQVVRRSAIERAFFNVFQKTLSIVAAVTVYRWLGGPVPPAYLLSAGETAFSTVLTGVAAFLAGATVFILANSLAVSGALALSTGGSTIKIWKNNTLWMLGYDIPMSLLALVVAFLYMISDRAQGASRLWFAGAFGLAIFLRIVYGKLSVLQGLYDELDKAHERLETSFREQLLMMVKSIEARDPYTSGHSRRVAKFSRALAEDLGLSAVEVDEIETAALLHDVGKIHAEFAPLLQKDGRLTQAEWELMKTHAAKSADLVALFSRFRGSVEDSVRHHHERWDGKGYPDGLSENEIPLGARVIMISDTIDAMTTDRPYRKALSFDVVVAELARFRGTQFDPSLVDVTVSSVSIRRMVSATTPVADDSVLDGHTYKTTRNPPLRSQRSFWEGLIASQSDR